MAGITGLPRAAEVSDVYAPRPIQRVQGIGQRSGVESDREEDEVSLSEQAMAALGGGPRLSPEQVKEALAIESIKLANDAQKQVLVLFG